MEFTENPNYYPQERPYKEKYICCDCRKCFKRRISKEVIREEEEIQPAKCPDCGQPTLWIGPKFRPPKTTDIKAWNSIGVLRRIGFAGFFGFATDSVKIPKGPKELKQFLTDYIDRYNHKKNKYVDKGGWSQEAFDFNAEFKTKIQSELDRLKSS